ncbi:MAG: hypothetical protein U9Q81_10580 [Pseudomonadota bacterium]|nr:hypothetical protein [Pseudomonadota bacterium]
MAGSESSKGLSLWPKLVLWGAVIVIGVLYLGSVDQQRSDDDRQEGAVPRPTEVEEAGTSTGADAISESEEGAGTVAGEQIGSVDAKVQVEVTTEQPAPAELGADVEGTTRVVVEPAEATAAPQPESIPEAREGLQAEQEPAPAQGAAALEDRPSSPQEQTAVEEPSQVPDAVPPQTQGRAPKGEQAAQEQPSEVTPEEAEAFAKAVISESDENQSGQQPTQVPDPPEPPASGIPASAPTTATAPPAQENWQERRTRIMAEYEAMRKRADEEMRRRWGPGGMGPYGAYPGYGPGYYRQPQPQPQPQPQQ